MAQIETVCNEIIKKSIIENVTLTPLKLQKIIYFIYAYGLANKKKKLFNACFYAWRYGPVSEVVYQEFKNFGDNQITRYSQDAKGISYFLNKNNSENNDLIECIEIVWNKYKNFSGSQLFRLTHKEGSAWNRTRTNQHIQEQYMIEDIQKGLY